MHIEIQVALNFVISFLYNKLPRRRVNIFGEELEKALKDKFYGHWYPDKPFKGSAFRCLKTSEPTDIVLEVAARESGVPIVDILENLPAELSVWVDPGEVSFRIGEKGHVKILYSEQKHTDIIAEADNCAADREVTTTFNPEAQCFRPIEIINNSMNALTLSSPKGSPNDTASISSTSPLYNKNNSNNTTNTSPSGKNATTFLGNNRREPVLFTTATFAQTKFGSTKLKSNSKRTNRMSPTEFSNYIKQRQQIQHHNSSNHYNNLNHPNIYGAFESVSPVRSISPNVVNLQQLSNNDNNLGFNQTNAAYNLYAQSFSNNMLGNSFATQFNSSSPSQETSAAAAAVMFANTKNLDANYPKLPQPQQQRQQQQQQQQQLALDTNSQIASASSPSIKSTNQSTTVSSDNNKLFDDLSSFYNTSNASSYQHLLVAN